jgi:arylformamidase
MSPHWQALSYGPLERHGIDWFGADPAGIPAGGAPLLVFIHGGFWRALDRHIFGFIAEHYAAAGIHVAMIGYELVPAVKLPTIVEQVKNAMRWLNVRAQPLRFDPARVSVSGHSAGGHLSGIVASTPPWDLAGRPLIATIPVSGVFDLAPLLITSVNHDVRMTAADAALLSPASSEVFHTGQMVVAVGGLETEGFVGQSRDFADTVRRHGVPAELQIVPDRTHFDILEDLSRPECALFQRVLAVVSGGRASTANFAA